MPRDTILTLFLVAATALPAVATSETSVPDFSLTYLDRFEIKDEGVTEPSGIALPRGGNALWTVSDDTNKIFKLSLDGRLGKEKSFEIDEEGLEGIALDPFRKFVLAVKEESNEILEISIESQKVVAHHALAEMAGFEEIEQHFSSGDANKGLEGITCNQHSGTIFVLKEGAPGLLIEISKNFGSILNTQVLDGTAGFIDDDVNDAEIDFSDIQYDETRSLFWIVSDKARRLYLYDWTQKRVLQSATLGFGKDGEYREIEQAEGVTVDQDSNRLYVVSDKEARLYVFDIR